MRLIAALVIAFPLAAIAQGKKKPPPQPEPEETELAPLDLAPLEPIEEKKEEKKPPPPPPPPPSKVKKIEAVPEAPPPAPAPEVKKEAPPPPQKRFVLAPEAGVGWTSEAESGDDERAARAGLRAAWAPVDPLELSLALALWTYRAGVFDGLDGASLGAARRPANALRFDARLHAVYVSPPLGAGGLRLTAGAGGRFTSFDVAAVMTPFAGATVAAGARAALSEQASLDLELAWTYNLAAAPSADPVGGPVALTELSAAVTVIGPLRLGYRGEVLALAHSYRFFHALEASVLAAF